MRDEHKNYTRQQCDTAMQPSNDPADELERVLVEQESKYRARVAASPDDGEAKFSLARFLAELTDGNDACAQQRWQEADALFQGLLNGPNGAAGGDGAGAGDGALSGQQRRTFARYRAWYASFLEGSNRWEEAERQYAAALSLHPTEPLGMGNHALLAQKQRRKSGGKAARLLEAALAAHPRHGSLVLKLAATKKAKQDLGGAEELYQRAAGLARGDDGEAAGAYAVTPRSPPPSCSFSPSSTFTLFSSHLLA
jgi:Flp pilus assembly protein TadD